MYFTSFNHAGNLLIHCSQTGTMVYAKQAQGYLYTMDQTGVETSCFSAESVALKIAAEIIQ